MNLFSRRETAGWTRLDGTSIEVNPQRRQWRNASIPPAPPPPQVVQEAIIIPGESKRQRAKRLADG